MSPRLEVHPFSLQHTVECGQFFRFTKDSGTYLVQSSGHIFSLWQKGKTLFYEGVDESFLVRFFRLEEELHPILRAIDQDPVIHQAIQTYRGLRLIRQDPWECLISYLCSMAKAIPHIRSIIEGLCKSSGKRIRFGNYIGYEFPEALCNGILLSLGIDWSRIQDSLSRERKPVHQSGAVDPVEESPLPGGKEVANEALWSRKEGCGLCPSLFSRFSRSLSHGHMDQEGATESLFWGKESGRKRDGRVCDPPIWSLGRICPTLSLSLLAASPDHALMIFLFQRVMPLVTFRVSTTREAFSTTHG